MSEDRPDPEAILARIRREEREQGKTGRGHLRIYLGAFPGVGKTYAMLSEAQRRMSYGEDVVVGFVETHGRKSTAAMVNGLEVVLDEMDVDAILRRRPAVCFVDELAHTNAAGSEREKRYEDVQLLLDAAIDVVTTLNVQHLESLNDTVESLTGVKVRETLPDAVLDEADEVILIDLSPEGARARMQHGHIYPPEQARTALEHFFRPENLAALRDLALRRTTHEVDEQLEEYMREAGVKAEVAERVLVLVDETPSSRALLRHAWRLAQGLDAELLIAYFRKDRTDVAERELARVLELAEDLNGQIRPLEGLDEASALAGFLAAEGVHHLVLQRESRKPLAGFVRPSLADRIVSKAPEVDVHLPSVST